MPIYATRIRSTNVSKAIFLNTSDPVEQTPRKEGRSITDTADTCDCPECLCPCCTNSLQREKIHYRHYRQRRLSWIIVSLLYKLIPKREDPSHTLQAQMNSWILESLLYKLIAKSKDPLQTLQTKAMFLNSCVPEGKIHHRHYRHRSLSWILVSLLYKLIA